MARMKRREPKRGRSRLRNLWHAGFAHLVRTRGPRGFAVYSEYELPRHARRADLVLIRRAGPDSGSSRARVLRALWPLLGRVAICELKTVSRSYEPGGLIKLVGHGIDYQLLQQEEAAHGRAPSIEHADDLTLVLIVPALNTALEADIEELRLEWQHLSRGYLRLDGTQYATYIVVIDEVSLAEKDEYLKLFSHHPVKSSVVSEWQDWLTPYAWRNKNMPRTKWDPQSVEEVWKKLVSSVPTKIRLDGVPVEERLRDVPVDEQILALPDKVLAALTPAFVATLPTHVQESIRVRLGRQR